MKKTRIAVLAGGPSSEREVSLKSGAQIASSLNATAYDVRLVELAKDIPTIASTLEGLRETTDLALIALHGTFGEDGGVQTMLDDLHIPYTGSDAAASATGMDKLKTMNIAQENDIRVPDFFVAEDFSTAVQQIRTTFGYPCVVKPNASGSSVGVTIVESEQELVEALRRAKNEDGTVIAQRYIAGRELTCGVLGNSDSPPVTALPPIEIIAGNKFFDYDAKYSSPETQEICPADIPKEVEKEVQKVSEQIHALLKCDGLTRSDFMLGKDGKLYFLEINTIPGMTEASLCPKEAKALGWSFSEFLDKIVELALRKKY